jgi:hypothetical protein
MNDEERKQKTLERVRAHRAKKRGVTSGESVTRQPIPEEPMQSEGVTALQEIVEALQESVTGVTDRMTDLELKTKAPEAPHGEALTPLAMKILDQVGGLTKRIEAIEQAKEDAAPQYDFEDHENRIMEIEAVMRGEHETLQTNNTKRITPRKIERPVSYDPPNKFPERFPKVDVKRGSVYTEAEKKAKLAGKHK